MHTSIFILSFLGPTR